MLATGACTTPLPRPSGLGDAVLALYLSPQAQDFTGPGEVVLVGPDGSTTSVPTSGMDNGQLLWTKAGLSFADTERDYLLGEELRSWPSAKATFQDILIETPQGVLGAYNLGNTDAGYVEQVVVSADGRSTLTEVAGDTTLYSLCEQGLVGVAEVTGKGLTELAAGSGAVKRSFTDYPQMMTWLSPKRATARLTLIGAVPSTDVGYVRGVAPCPHGVVVFLAASAGPDGREGSPEVWRWDTRGGAPSRVELRNADGSPIALTPDQFSTSTQAPALGPDGRLVWYGGDGVVRASDPRTGLTEELWDSGLPVDRNNDSRVLFAGEWLFLLDVPNDDQRRPMTLYRRTALTGEGAPVVTITGVNQTRTLRHVLRGIAVAPSLTR